MTKPWEEQDDESLKQVLKQAKRRTWIRNISISLIVSIAAVILIQFGALQLTYRASDHALREEILYRSMTSPNEYEGGYRDQRGFLSGTLELSTYKIVEGVPVPWGSYWTDYKVPGFLKLSGTGGRSGIQVTDSEMQREDYKYNRSYNAANGQRELMFYIPGVDYNGKIIKDLNRLANLPSPKVAELAISFDMDYSLAEVQSMLPQGVRPVWYWVDTYDNRETFHFKPYKDETGGTSYPLPMTKIYNVYGFGIHPDSGRVDAGDFVRNVEYGLEAKGRYYKEYERIYNYLKKDKDAPDESDVRLLGVVVTGTPQQLERLQGQPYVRAAVLGAVADKY